MRTTVRRVLGDWDTTGDSRRCWSVVTPTSWRRNADAASSSLRPPLMYDCRAVERRLSSRAINTYSAVMMHIGIRNSSNVDACTMYFIWGIHDRGMLQTSESASGLPSEWRVVYDAGQCRQSDVDRRGSGRCEYALSTAVQTETLQPRVRSEFWQRVPVSRQLEHVVDDISPHNVRRWTPRWSAQTLMTWVQLGTSWTRSTADRNATDMLPRWYTTLEADLYAHQK